MKNRIVSVEKLGGSKPKIFQEFVSQEHKPRSAYRDPELIQGITAVMAYAHAASN